jgi:hypothetical protein
VSIPQIMTFSYKFYLDDIREFGRWAGMMVGGARGRRGSLETAVTLVFLKSSSSNASVLHAAQLPRPGANHTMSHSSSACHTLHGFPHVVPLIIAPVSSHTPAASPLSCLRTSVPVVPTSQTVVCFSCSSAYSRNRLAGTALL